MSKHFLPKNKKGFTLVELVIVIAVSAIVVTMVCTFLQSFLQKTYNTKVDIEYIDDINELREEISAWATQYDSACFDISISADGKTVTSTRNELGDGVVTTVGGGTLSYSEAGLYNSIGNTTRTFKVVKDMTFTFPKKSTKNSDNVVVDTAEENTTLLQCKIIDEEGNEVTMLFPFRAKIPRNRYSSEIRNDLSKLETSVESWLSDYKSYTITAESGKLVAKKSAFNTKRLYFDKTNQRLCQDSSTTWIDTYYGMLAATDAVFSIVEEGGEKVVQCVVTFSSATGVKTQTITWSMP